MNEQAPNESKESQLHEEVFLGIIFKELLEEVTDSLFNAGYLETSEEIGRFDKIIASLSSEDKKRLFSIPFELREKRFKIFRSQNIPIEFMIKQLIKEAEVTGYTLGYHLSPFEIKKENGKDDAEWKIKGTELDDRDEKLMAYYSTDFDSLYRKHHQKHLYVVRANLGEKSSHKYDLSNNWGRATELSIVDHFDFEKVNEEVKKQVKEEMTKAA